MFNWHVEFSILLSTGEVGTVTEPDCSRLCGGKTED